MEHVGSSTLYNQYKQETSEHKKRLNKKSFLTQWAQVVRLGVTDPETSAHYRVVILQSRAKGFAVCNDCKYFQMRMRSTKGKDWTKRAEYQRKFQQHLALVTDDREELARIQRLCITNQRHCGFFLDAADSAKFQVPTTQSTAKMLSQLWRIRQKLTCVQMFDLKKTLYIFRTLPNIPTGGNLTCTVLTALFNLLARSKFQQCTDLHINIDGAGDNVCYTLQYFLVHILICAHDQKWKLRRIHVLRMRVGHTHNDLDATFALLSRHVYGKHSRGDSRKDILSFAAFAEVRMRYTLQLESISHTRARTHQICKTVYGPRLEKLTTIKRVYNFDKFLKNYRPRRADRGLQQHFSMEFEVRQLGDVPHVFVRSKAAMGAKTPWNGWTQMFPSLMDVRRDASVVHAPDTVPPVLDNKEWDDFDIHVVPSLHR